jgi:hypothetical protein
MMCAEDLTHHLIVQHRHPHQGAAKAVLTRVDYLAFKAWAGDIHDDVWAPECAPGEKWAGGSALGLRQAKRACAALLPESVVAPRRGWRKLLPTRWWPFGGQSSSSSSSSSQLEYVTAAPVSSVRRSSLLPPAPPLIVRLGDALAWRSHFGLGKAMPAAGSPRVRMPTSPCVPAGR